MAAAGESPGKKRRVTRRGARLLDLRAPLAVLRIARTFLVQARQARRRLDTKGDAEALHDFRVALRRLRSTLRLYRGVLGQQAVPDKLQRRLKRLARIAGAARDADVGIAWLRRERRGMQDAERAACDRLMADWRARRNDAYAELHRALKKRFDKPSARLLRALNARPATTAPLLRQTAGRLMREQVTALADALRRIGSAADTETIHDARIEAKRLRYLLEPIAAELPDGAALVQTLKGFQDDFGALCDCQMVSEELLAAADRYDSGRIAREMRRVLGRARPTSEPTWDIAEGLLALARRLSAERKRRYAMIEERYLGDKAQSFLAPWRALADTLAGAAGPAPRRPMSSASSTPQPQDI